MKRPSNGYKDHVKVDTDSKLIKTYEVTDASVHDSQVAVALLEKADAGTELHADSARPKSSAESKENQKQELFKDTWREEHLKYKEFLEVPWRCMPWLAATCLWPPATGEPQIIDRRRIIDATDDALCAYLLK